MRAIIWVLVVAFVLVVSATLCSLAWDWAVVPVFGVRSISIWEAFKLQVACSLLIGAGVASATRTRA